MPRQHKPDRPVRPCGCGCSAQISAFDKRGRPRRYVNGHAQITHGNSRRGRRTTEYIIWILMWQRCSNPNLAAYKHYGARGIRVCSQWSEFKNFLRDMGHRPEGRTLDRIDNDGNYEPSNCRWATPKEQRHNSRQKVNPPAPVGIKASTWKMRVWREAKRAKTA